MTGLAQLQAKQLARKGRHGDTKLLHVSDTEIAALDGIASLMTGKPLPTNPDTGAKEAFLFTPLLASLIAPGLGVSSVLGTAAVAGGLGAAEAAARGMDNPIEQGLMAGLTTGGGMALSGALGAAGQGVGATAGEIVPMGSTFDAAGAMPGMQGSMMAMQNAQVMGADAVTGASMLPPSMQQNAMLGVQDASMSGMFAGDPMSSYGMTADALAGGTPAYMQPHTLDPNSVAAAKMSSPHQGYFTEGSVPDMKIQDMLAQNAPPVTTPNAPSMMGDMGGKFSSGVDALTNKFSQMGQGAKAIMSDDAALRSFMANPDTKYGAMALGAGLTGSAALSQQQKANESADSDAAQRKADMDKLYKQIADSERSAGTPWWEKDSALMNFGPYGRFRDGGSVFPMKTGGFVMTNKAVKGAGGGSEKEGLMALKKHIGAKPIRGKGHGTSDSIPARIDGKHPAKVSNGEAYVPPENVKKAGGSRKMYETLRRLEAARRG